MGLSWPLALYRGPEEPRPICDISLAVYDFASVARHVHVKHIATFLTNCVGVTDSKAYTRLNTKFLSLTVYTTCRAEEAETYCASIRLANK